MTYTRIAAVTGANKGIGFSIVRNIVLDYPNSSLNNGPLLIYLTARDKQRGEQALADIHADSQLKKAKALKADGGLADVKYAQLDINSLDSIKHFETFLKKEHPQGIDVLVNNAGVALNGFDANVVKDTLACNYYGTLHITQNLLPHIRQGGRIVNVSSMVGKLNKYSDDLTKRFKSANQISQISGLMDAFQKSVAAGTYSEDGWPSSAYAVSKAGVTGMSQILGQQVKADGKGVLLNACCPGYVKTDMTKGGGRKTADQGARTPVKLAIGDIGDVSGGFWENEGVSTW